MKSFYNQELDKIPRSSHSRVQTGKTNNILRAAVVSNASSRDNQIVRALPIPQEDMQPVRVELLVEGQLVRKDGKDECVVLGKFH